MEFFQSDLVHAQYQKRENPVTSSIVFHQQKGSHRTNKVIILQEKDYALEQWKSVFGFC